MERAIEVINRSISTDDLIIQNAQRIPKNPRNNYDTGAPEAIIVKLMMTDRNLIIHHARTTTLIKGMIIRHDNKN